MQHPFQLSTNKSNSELVEYMLIDAGITLLLELYTDQRYNLKLWGSKQLSKP